MKRRRGGGGGVGDGMRNEGVKVFSQAPTMCSGAGGNSSGLWPFMVTGRWPQEESVIYSWDMHEEPGAEKFNDFPSDPQEGSGTHNILLQEYLDQGLKVSFFKSKKRSSPPSA